MTVAAIARQNSHGPVTLVLESAWLPLMLVDMGVTLLNGKQVLALVRHHLGTLYGSPADPISEWDIRVDHRAGERFALAYGLSGRLKGMLLAESVSAGIRWSSIEPAFDWGRRQSAPGQPKDHRYAWWVWREQDRQVVAHLKAGRVSGLHPAMPCAESIDEIVANVRAEEARLGIQTDPDSIGVGAWEPMRQRQDEDRRVSWHVLGTSFDAVGGALNCSAGSEVVS
jgi:hypothetical protein